MAVQQIRVPLLSSRSQKALNARLAALPIWPRSGWWRAAWKPPLLLPLLAPLLVGAAWSLGMPALAQQSSLLESVKQNPQRAKALCDQLRQFNAQGVSFTSSQVTGAVASQQNLSPSDAEVMITYVAGFYCPDVR
jgi:hypothetical protein